ncbi:uncharacterized protein LOC143039581 [Oratosquilla oratoria]|uniref:uncharacterized protein LOC143039581 n=1 Tax=Oratosquilla oratoria TaxID=337810 RepID=UPI003F76C006
MASPETMREWADWEEGFFYANPTDAFLYPIPIGVALIVLRFGILYPLIFTPVAKYMGLIKRARGTAATQPSTGGTLTTATGDEENLSDKEDHEAIRQQERLERQLSMEAASRKKLKKFQESAWQMTYYASMTVWGAWVMYDRPWAWKIQYCWTSFPNRSIGFGLWSYIMTTLAYYWSSIITHFLDVRHKDFWVMLGHHMVTILLLTGCYITHTWRGGSLIILVHDVADVPLNGAKLFRYLNLEGVCNVVFVIFVVVWVASRLVYLPFWIVHSVLTEMIYIVVPMTTFMYILVGFLLSLIVIHCYWTVLIFRIIYKVLTRGDLQDNRSSSEDESDGDAPVRKLNEDTKKLD